MLRFAPLLACVALLTAPACTGRTLPRTGDGDTGDTGETGETGETGSSTSDADESTQTSGSETESGETDTTDTDTTETTETETETETETGDQCAFEVVSDLMIDEDTPVEELACLREVVDRLWIRHVDWTDLSYLPALEKVGKLELYDDVLLEDLSGTSLVEIGNLSLSLLPSLGSTAGLEQLVALDTLYLGISPLVSLELPLGLPTRAITVYTGGADLDQLASLQPQPSGAGFYVYVGSGSIVDLGALALCCQFPELDITIVSDSSLSDLTSLGDFTTLHGLHLHSSELTDFTGLEQLESIGTLEASGTKCDSFDWWGEPRVQLTSLNGLDSLMTIDSLALRFIYDFQSLDGLPPGASINTLELRNLNPLGQAEAEAFAADVQAQTSWLCGFGGEELCLAQDEWEGICPQ